MTSKTVQHRAREAASDEVVKEAIVESLRKGLSYERAADLAGIERTTLWRWRKADREFSAACRRAVAVWVDQEFSKVDDPKWRLERRLPREFSQRTEVRQFGDEDNDERDDARELSDAELEDAARGGK